MLQKKFIYGMLLLSSLVTLTESFIVPQELPSILSLVYSNIPPIKKGTDSRVGFGYRFGDHADFQIQFELGPQKETKPIGSINSPSKRYSQSDDEAQLQRVVRRQESRPSIETTTSKGWLQSIFDQFRSNFIETTTTTSRPQSLSLRRVPLISSSAYRHLQKLYESARVNLDERGNEIDSDATLTEEPSSGHHLPKAALDILRGGGRPEQQQQQQQQQVRNSIDSSAGKSRSKQKIDSITRDLSNVDLD